MVRAPAREGAPLLRRLLVRWCTFLLSLATGVSVYRLYGIIFPFINSPAGFCKRCGARTNLYPSGWATFCNAHSPHFRILQIALVFSEAISFLVTVIALWLILRLNSEWGGKSARLVMVIICMAFMIMFVVLSRQELNLAQQFVSALFIMFFVLSAVYADSLESIIVMSVVAVGLAALIAFIIQIINWLLIGYMELVPATLP